MRKALLTAVALLSFTPASIFAKDLIVKPGETLSEIADRHNISMIELMERNNITNPNQIRTGQKIILPSNLYDKQVINHIVKSGESVNSIALDYNTTKSIIINANNLSNENYLYIGQTIKVPTSNRESNLASSEVSNKSIPDYHVISSGETLGVIAKKYNISIKTLIAVNNLKNANNILVGDKLLLNDSSTRSIIKQSNQNKNIESLAMNNKVDMRAYGPLQVDWANLKSINGSYVAQSIHKNGQSLFLAINCSFRKINATGANGGWKAWTSPLETFEHKLVDDICKFQST